jgi:hypothetical protein
MTLTNFIRNYPSAIFSITLKKNVTARQPFYASDKRRIVRSKKLFPVSPVLPVVQNQNCQ